MQFTDVPYKYFGGGPLNVNVMGPGFPSGPFVVDVDFAFGNVKCTC